MKYGIDVSFHKGFPDWKQCKGKVQFAILAVTERRGDDKTFEHNYSGARSIGVPIGAYKYSYARTWEESKAEAQRIIDILAGRPLEMGIWLDLEWDTQKRYTMELRQDIIEGFREVVEENGYVFGGIYCNLEWFQKYIPAYAKRQYQFWLASYPMYDDGSVVERVKPQAGNLSGWQYTQKGRVPGFGEQDVDRDIWYADIPGVEDAVPEINAETIINIARAEMGNNQFDLSHKHIIDTYNSHSPLARGYRVTYTDSWCDTFVSYLFIKAGAVDLIGGTECGVEEHVKKFIAKGIWNEDGSGVPIPGDIIVFNWDGDAQPNDGYSDHIGIVESVSGGIIHTIEGNSGGTVAQRTYHVGEGCIRGYARPEYGEGKTTKTPQEAPERPVTPLEPIVDEMPTLTRGSTGEAVRTLQSKLNVFFPLLRLDVDGIFGPATEAAVLRFQTTQNLAIDGVVGPETWRALIRGKSVEELAYEAIAGKWGNGTDRKVRLENAGYDYHAVQASINSILAKQGG